MHKWAKGNKLQFMLKWAGGGKFMLKLVEGNNSCLNGLRKQSCLNELKGKNHA